MPHVPRETLESYVAGLVDALGAPARIADQVAASLVDADSHGHSSHGIVRVPFYAGLIEDGTIDPGATPVTVLAEGPLGQVDGRRAYGQVVGRHATDLATERASDHGVGVVGIRRATHLGRVGEWAERAASDGYLFAALLNSGAGFQTVAPAGSADRRLSTNPLGFGVPTFDALPFPIVYDAATSQVAGGKIRERALTGEPLHEDWVVTETGESVTDAGAYLDGEGALRPLGGESAGHKGFGLAVVAELFAGMVGDGIVQGMDHGVWSGNVTAFLAVDPRRFADEGALAEKVAVLASHLRDADSEEAIPVGAAAKGDEHLLPGEAEYRAADRADREGVPVKPDTARELRAIAVEHGIEDAVPDTLDE